MSRTEHRIAAMRLCLLVFAGAASIVLWLAVLSFDPADPPAVTVWPRDNVEHPSNLVGHVGAWLAYHLHYYLGWGVFPLLMFGSGFAGAAANGWRAGDAWLRTIGVIMVTAGASGVSTLFVPAGEAFLVTGPGGVLGLTIVHFLQPGFHLPGATLVLAFTIVVGALFAADEAVVAAVRWLRHAGRQSLPVLSDGSVAVVRGVKTGWSGALNHLATVRETVSAATAGYAPADVEELPAAAKSRAGSSVSASRKAEVAPAEDDEVVEVEDEDEEADEFEDEAEEEFEEDEETEAAAPPKPNKLVSTPKPRVHETPAPRPVAPAPRREQVGEFVLPPLRLLGDPEPIDKSAITQRCREQAHTLEQTLNEFRLEVRVASIETGPVITVFELALSPGIKVSQIASLTNDMARALRAPAVRVVAPLPGRNTVGIEVPNLDKEKVRIKDLMLHTPSVEKMQLPLFLGKDASGQPLTSDLAKMPHLLIAGTTGSGKSVCVSSIIMSFLLTRSPDEVQLVLVDPKVVELTMFKDIPHLMCPIVTDMARAEGILEWGTTKMDERYALLAEAGVKDIVSYNKLGEAGLRERMCIDSDEEFAKIPIQLPYIVIVIDELADMMMTAAKEVEFHLCRLAQKSRAVGIHLIVSTQRPQANVVTGLIKSNLPSRIAFRVSSRLDSRIVLDQNGGEVLMGMGDMLFLPPGSSKLVRAQGAYVGDDELRAVVKHCKEQRGQNFSPELMRPPKSLSEEGERDELFDDAVRIIIDAGRGSVSLLQRKLTIGYGRASRLVEQMYEAGIVGEYKGSQAREVVMTMEEWEAARAQRDSDMLGFGE